MSAAQRAWATPGVVVKKRALVRFILIVVFLALAVLAGLFIYGQSLQPQTRVIEQEAIDAS
ncbi:MAG: hypothetical protein AAGA09_06145 [Pseudomonadota bacterium]